MDEYMYLSRTKVAQSSSRGRWRLMPLTLRVATPFGGVDVELQRDASDAELAHLRRVVRHVSRRTFQFTDHRARAGRWISFEAPLNYFVLGDGEDRTAHLPTVLFTDPPGSVAGYDPQGDRLLLHGSARHLLPQGSPELQQSTGEFPYQFHGPSTVHGFVHLFPQVRLPLVGPIAGPRFGDPYAVDIRGRSVIHRAPGLFGGTHALVSTVDDQWHLELATWARGLARVTANLAGPQCGGARHSQPGVSTDRAPASAALAPTVAAPDWACVVQGVDVGQRGVARHGRGPAARGRGPSVPGGGNPSYAWDRAIETGLVESGVECCPVWRSPERR
ncbi:SAVMC3_10250 family protein [Streptomyces sp. NPDC001401]|uniref:SAVMC3_10250 family protein n=1 Tax=Streptomyces sp. NPDC001401 TaxID=3364570 RepID=UPI0036779752